MLLRVPFNSIIRQEDEIIHGDDFEAKGWGCTDIPLRRRAYLFTSQNNSLHFHRLCRVESRRRAFISVMFSLFLLSSFCFYFLIDFFLFIFFKSMIINFVRDRSLETVYMYSDLVSHRCIGDHVRSLETVCFPLPAQKVVDFRILCNIYIHIYIDFV